MKNNKITNAYDKIVPNDFAKQRVWNKVTAEKQKKRAFFPKLVAVATALAIIGATHSLFLSPADNSFTVQAYFMAPHTEERMDSVEFNFSTNELLMAGFHDGIYLYTPIYLDVSGENIARVEFSVDSGFFVRQYRDYNNVMFYFAPFENVVFCNAADDTFDFKEIIPLMFNTEFELLGNQITSEDILVDSHSLLLAIPHHPGDFLWVLEREIWIDVVVTFNDGEIKSDIIELYFHNTSSTVRYHPNIGMFGDFILSLNSLDNATLIPESVQILPKYEDPLGNWDVDVYIWEREGGIIYASSLLFQNPGDEQRYSLIKVGDDVVLSLIRVNEDGVLVGMEYIISGEIIPLQGLDNNFQPTTVYIIRQDDGSTWRLPVLPHYMWTWDEDE